MFSVKQLNLVKGSADIHSKMVGLAKIIILSGFVFSAFVIPVWADEVLTCAEFISIKARQKPFAQEIPPEKIQAELNRLTAKGALKLLLKTNDHFVYLIRGSEIPQALDEVGRRRAITFENAGEGIVGLERDLDRFDQHYGQVLIVESKNGVPTGELDGGMRLVRLQDVLASPEKINGLYTNSQIKYSEEFLRDIGDAVELGRSFVINEKQGGKAGKLLFESLAAYLIEYPRTDTYFGVVSVSVKNYKNSIHAIFEFLRRQNQGNPYEGKVAAKNPPTIVLSEEIQKLFDEGKLEKFGQLNELVRKLDGRDLPPLLSFYSIMGAHFPVFDYDADFRVWDALTVLDLRTMDVSRLRRMFRGNKEGLRKVLKAQGRADQLK